jgi:hypothetical protein
MLRKALLSVLAMLAGSVAPAAIANVVTDWDERAVKVASTVASTGQRELALMHVAMFGAVNSIARRYHPYLAQVEASSAASVDAAAASAAATVLRRLRPDSAADIDAALARDLAGIRASDEARSEGVKVGAAVASKVLDARENDGSDGAGVFRLDVKAGVYVPTMTMVGATWPNMKPFVMQSPSQFRPAPPIALASSEWAADFSEVKSYGAKSGSKRSAQQTETARFWLMTGPPAYHPVARQVVLANQLSVVDSARFMAVFAVALADAYIAVFDAKYHHSFWRPVTAIHNAAIDGNAQTEPDPSWQPVSDTPMHPEYPCAHCIQSGAAIGVVESLLGSGKVVHIELTSPTAPGVTHRWTSLGDFADEVASARIWAGFHYRFSTRVGTEMGMKIGRLAAQKIMQPATAPLIPPSPRLRAGRDVTHFTHEAAPVIRPSPVEIP